MNLGQIKRGIFLGVVAMFALGFARGVKAEIVPCTFSGNLETGSISESVRCIQKFLNEKGYVITDSGGGAPGHETTTFGDKTKVAIKKWQAANGISPTGIFGPLSQAQYFKTIQAELQAQLSSVTPSNSVTTPVPTVSTDEKHAKSKLQDAYELWQKTDNDIDDADSSKINIDSAKRDIDDAKDDLVNGVFAFLDGDFEKAINKAENVTSSMTDIQDQLHGDSKNAQQSIDDARSAISDAQDEIDQAQQDGDHTDNARDLLDKATKKLNDAKRAYSREQFDSAKSLARQAENYANDAIDAIGN